MSFIVLTNSGTQIEMASPPLPPTLGNFSNFEGTKHRTAAWKANMTKLIKKLITFITKK